MQIYLYFRETVKKVQISKDLSAKPLTSSMTMSLSKTSFSHIPKSYASSLILIITPLLLPFNNSNIDSNSARSFGSETQQKHNKSSLLFDVLLLRKVQFSISNLLSLYLQTFCFLLAFVQTKFFRNVFVQQQACFS